MDRISSPGQDAGGERRASPAGRCRWSRRPPRSTGTTHCETEATTAPGWAVATPCTVTSTVSSTTAMSRFIIGPPSMTMTFLGTGQLVEHPVLVARADLLQARGPRLVDELAEPARARDPHRAGGVALARREHADHPDVAAERDRLDAVLGLAAAARPHRRAEADHVLGDAHAEPLGRHEVPDLVQGDRRGDPGRHEQHTEDEGDGGQRFSQVRSSSWATPIEARQRRCRAHRSAASTPSTLEAS